jgi:hypothetical protein
MTCRILVRLGISLPLPPRFNPPSPPVKRHNAFFQCARELAETYAQKDQQVLYYLVTDSQHLKRDAQRALGSTLVVTNLVPQHVHQKSGHVDAVYGAIIENWILAKTDMRVATQDSGFVSFFFRSFSLAWSG